MSRYTGQNKCSVYMKSDVEDRDKCRMCITFGTILYRIGRENSQNVRLGGGALYYGCSEPVSDEPLFKKGQCYGRY